MGDFSVKMKQGRRVNFRQFPSGNRYRFWVYPATGGAWVHLNDEKGNDRQRAAVKADLNYFKEHKDLFEVQKGRIENTPRWDSNIIKLPQVVPVSGGHK